MPGPAVTINHLHTCPLANGPAPHVGGPVVGPGEATVLIAGQPAAVVGDFCTCAGPPDAIVQGEANVLIGGKPAVTLGSLTAHGGVLIQGEGTVLIGTRTPEPVTIPRHNILRPSPGKDGWSQEAQAGQDALDQAAPEEEVPEEVPTVDLRSTFARDQLIVLSKYQPRALFMAVFMKTFGRDIPSEAYAAFYDDVVAEATILDAPLSVRKRIPYGGGGAAFYSNYEEGIHEIFVSEATVLRAVEEDQNAFRGELLTMLVEEYGHYLDYLLRHYYALTANRDAMRDEGARYAYNLYVLNPIEQADQHFATATVDGAETELIWDFTGLHDELKQYVNEERQDQDDNRGNYEFYKAGFINPHEGNYGHGDIEEEALRPVLERLAANRGLRDSEIKPTLDKIYLGNWLRDFSQAVDPMVIRPMAMGIEVGANVSDDVFTKDADVAAEARRELENVMNGPPMTERRSVNVTVPEDVNVDLEFSRTLITINVTTDVEALAPVRVSADFIATAIELAAVREFMRETDAAGRKIDFDQSADFQQLLAAFREQYKMIDRDVLGAYRPEEHIDNPKGVGWTTVEGQPPIDRHDEDLYHKFIGAVADNSQLHGIATWTQTVPNPGGGMKNYIRGPGGHYFTKPGGRIWLHTAHEYIKSKLRLAIGKPFMSTDGLVELGAGLHTLEDFFAHSNYCEVCLIKIVDPAVFPWITHVPETNFTYRYQDVRDYRVPTQDKWLFPEHKLAGNRVDMHRLAACIPIVTGTFGTVDTAASIAPIMLDDILKLEIEPWEKTVHGRRTYADLLILELAKDFDANMLTEGGPAGNANLHSFVSKAFDLRDNVARVNDFLLPDFIEKIVHYIKEVTGMLISFPKYILANVTLTVLYEAQVALGLQLTNIENGGTIDLGTNPSHTQVAKDDVDNPLHELSAKLAIHCVGQVGEAFFSAWRRGGSADAAIELLDGFMVHPAMSQWQDENVLEWARGNRANVCKASSPSIVIDRLLHSVEHMEEGIKAVATFAAEGGIMDELATFFHNETGNSGDPVIDVQALREKINTSLQNSHNLRRRILAVRHNWVRQYPKPSDCGRVKEGDPGMHYVVYGQDLTEIAAAYGTTIERLMELNPQITNRDTIVAGTHLQVPRRRDPGR